MSNPNHDREDLENQGAAGIGIITAIGAGIISALALSSSNKKKLQEINAEISDIDRQISEYKSKFFGSVFYADEISYLENKRDQLIARRNKLM